MTLRVLIADDEPLALARMQRLLESEPDVEIVAACADGAQAAEAMRTLRPDVAFLDIAMPELDGFEVIEAAAGVHAPAIVFVTAYDRYAIRAFEEQALDYVLKPVERERLHRSLERVRARVAPAEPTLSRIIVRTRGRIALISIGEVTHIEAAGNYARIHTRSEHHLIRQRMSDLETKLDPRRFVRIHRSTIVNIAAVREVRPWFRGDAVLVLEDGRELTVSRTYRERLTRALDASSSG